MSGSRSAYETEHKARLFLSQNKLTNSFSYNRIIASPLGSNVNIYDIHFFNNDTPIKTVSIERISIKNFSDDALSLRIKGLTIDIAALVLEENKDQSKIFEDINKYKASANFFDMGYYSLLLAGAEKLSLNLDIDIKKNGEQYNLNITEKDAFFGEISCNIILNKNFQFSSNDLINIIYKFINHPNFSTKDYNNLISAQIDKYKLSIQNGVFIKNYRDFVMQSTISTDVTKTTGLTNDEKNKLSTYLKRNKIQNHIVLAKAADTYLQSPTQLLKIYSDSDTSFSINSKIKPYAMITDLINKSSPMIELRHTPKP